MIAKWAGMVIQDNGLDYPVALTIKDSGIEVDYPTLGCGGVLRPVWFVDVVFRAVEHIERGLGSCVEGIEAVLRPTAERQLNYSLEASYIRFISSQVLTASAKLLDGWRPSLMQSMK